MAKRMMHVSLCPGEVGGYVLMPGSPERAVRLSAYLENAQQMAYFRE